jgi:hypothetical protein
MLRKLVKHILDVSVRVFPEMTGMWVSELSEEDLP